MSLGLSQRRVHHVSYDLKTTRPLVRLATTGISCPPRSVLQEETHHVAVAVRSSQAWSNPACRVDLCR